MELGIKGHQTRGDEVIKILETLGGVNRYNVTGVLNKYFYYIGSDKYKEISSSYIGPDEIKGYEIFSLDDFLKKFPYKVGDKVNVWINYDYFGGRAELEVAEIKSMRWNSARSEIAYKMKDITKEIYKNDIKGKVNEEHQIGPTIDYYGIVMNELEEERGFNLPDGYHFTDENGNVIDATKILLVKNAPSYPKTYYDCCEVMGWGGIIGFTGLDNEEEDLYVKFIILKRCRDVYWQIAGEELGLDKPWKPCDTKDKYVIFRSKDEILKGYNISCILEFPTPEMRDAFYENFKELIEQCKELL